MDSHIYDVENSVGQDIWSLLEELYPIPRTIMGKDFDKSLSIIEKKIPIERLSFETGTDVNGWTVPYEWRVEKATLSSLDGEVIIDYKDNPMHLWQYSISIDKEVSREELEQHLSSKLDCPKAIPHTVTFYNNNWGFSLTEEQKSQLIDKRYRVKIKTSFGKGALNIGQIFLPGSSEKEILIDSVLSCPSLGNNITGSVVSTFIAKSLLKKKNRYFSYRFVFTPETIGPLILLKSQNINVKNILGGYTLYNLGDVNFFNYKRSRSNKSIVDCAMEHSLRWFGSKHKIQDFDVMTGSCGNEKAYNSLGLEINIGAFSRSKLGSYAKYDTSLDNLSFVRKDTLLDSFKVCMGAIEAIERSQKFKHTYKGEPFLTGYGLYPEIKSDLDRIPYDYLMAFATGDMTLVEIANQAKIPVDKLDKAVQQFVKFGLIVEDND